MYAGFAGGFKVSPANSSYTARELAHQIHTSQAAVVVVHPLFVKNLLDAFKLLGVSEDAARKRMILGDWNEKLDEPSPTGFLSINDLIGKGKLAEEAKFGKVCERDSPSLLLFGNYWFSKGRRGMSIFLVPLINLESNRWASTDHPQKSRFNYVHVWPCFLSNHS